MTKAEKKMMEYIRCIGIVLSLTEEEAAEVLRVAIERGFLPDDKKTDTNMAASQKGVYGSGDS